MNERASWPGRVRCGRISYINVLPVYQPLTSRAVAHEFDFFSAPPAQLNERMRAGELDISAISSIEYAKAPERYVLVPDLAIGSRGPVRSVLLLSQVPFSQLDGRAIRVTAETNTSAALLRLVLRRVLQVDARLEAAGPAGTANNPGWCADATAVLAIGDEALRLRRQSGFAHLLDLGEVWLRWTGLPFIFGLWALRREFLEEAPRIARDACAALIAAKAWGLAHLEDIIEDACGRQPLLRREMADYFAGLSYGLDPDAKAGLYHFFACLASEGIIPRAPELRFAGDRHSWTARESYA